VNRGAGITRRTLLAGGIPSLARAAEKPNLVLFLSDDHGYFDSPVYGSKAVRTPNMESMANAGKVFTGVFTGSPTCVPSRSILMSGLLPARNGALPNHSGLTPGIRTLPTFLAASGYDVFHFGKSHFQPASNFRDWTPVPSEINGGPLNADLDTAAVEKWLAQRTAARTGKPLCLVICSHSPHVYWRANAGYDPRLVELPPTWVDTPETRNERARYYSDVTFADQQLGEVRASCRKHLSKNTLFLYTSDNGAQWPFAKWSLYDAGIHMPFLAEWPGVIAPGSRSNALISFCDLLPTLVEIAGGQAPPDLDGRSFAKVLLGKAATHRREIYAAHSGDRDFNVFPTRCVRTARYKYILNLHPEFQYTTHIDTAGPNDGRIYFDSWVEKAKTDPDAERIVKRYHEHPAEELYDVVADPHETRNLAGEAAATVRELRVKVQAWMKAQGDRGEVFGKPRLRATASSGAGGPGSRMAQWTYYENAAKCCPAAFDRSRRRSRG
jgi:N-sulfoglucosamine sulfohydrolase